MLFLFEFLSVFLVFFVFKSFSFFHSQNVCIFTSLSILQTELTKQTRQMPHVPGNKKTLIVLKFFVLLLLLLAMQCNLIISI